MYPKSLDQILWEAYDDGCRRIEADLRRFIGPLNAWIHDLLSRTLPSDWRQRLGTYLDSWEPEGFEVDPDERRKLERWIENWARLLYVWSEKPVAPNAVEPADRRLEVTLERAEEDSEPTTQTEIVSPKPASPPPTWPRLTPRERERAQQGTGLPWWYPQPQNRADSIWQLKFEGLGQASRDRLLAVYRELAALGRMTASMAAAKEADLSRLVNQRGAVQQAYDAYVGARIQLEGEWARYLRTETLVGIEVMALMLKIEAALPVRIDGLKSPLDARFEQARRESLRASESARRRVEGIYTATAVADLAITAIEIVSFVGTIRAGMRQILKQAVATGASREAATKAMITYAATQIAVAATSGAIASQVVPKVLSAAGLDDTEVQIGLAAFAVVGIAAGLAARPTSRLAASKRFPKAPRRPPSGKIKFFPPIEGSVDKNRTPEHTFLQRTMAEEMQASGDYIRIGMGMPISDFSGQWHSPNIHPDDLGLTADGKIDIIEILSPFQTTKYLTKLVIKAMNQLPEDMRGEFRVIDPKDAFK